MKTEGRRKIEKAIMNKIQSIFDNANLIDEFEMTLKGGVGENTTIVYKVAERIVPQLEENDKECPYYDSEVGTCRRSEV